MSNPHEAGSKPFRSGEMRIACGAFLQLEKDKQPKTGNTKPHTTRGKEMSEMYIVWVRLVRHSKLLIRGSSKRGKIISKKRQGILPQKRDSNWTKNHSISLINQVQTPGKWDRPIKWTTLSKRGWFILLADPIFQVVCLGFRKTEVILVPICVPYFGYKITRLLLPKIYPTFWAPAKLTIYGCHKSNQYNAQFPPSFLPLIEVGFVCFPFVFSLFPIQINYKRPTRDAHFPTSKWLAPRFMGIWHL